MREGEYKAGKEAVEVMEGGTQMKAGGYERSPDVWREVDENIEEMADIILKGSNLPEDKDVPDFKRDFNEFWKILRDELDEKLKNPRMPAFLAAYSIIGSVTYSAKCAGVSTSAIYHWKKNNPVFMEYYERAEMAHTEYLEMEAQRRAVMGVEEDVYYQGEVVGKKRNYSDTLLKFLLKGKEPGKYGGASKVEINADKNANIQVNFGIPELNEEIDTSEIEG